MSVLDFDGALAAGVHEGPAVVERSTNAELVLTFEPRDAATTPGSAGSGGDDGTGGAAVAATVFHTTFTGVPDAARFAPGTRLWLTLQYGPPTSWFNPPAPWSASIRDRKNGTLLFGGSYHDFDSAAAPIQVGALTPICTGPSPDTQCAPSATVTYSSLEVLGDQTVVVDDSATETVTVDGVPYEVRIHAQQSSADPCVDYIAPGGVTLDIEATNLDELVKTLDVDAVGVCSQGNDPSITFFFDFYGVDSDSTYEGLISYRGRDPNSASGYEFDVPGLTSTTDLPPTLTIEGATALLPEPAIGQEFWVLYQGTRVQVLRESQTGPVLLAQGWDFGNEMQRLADDFGNALGVPLRIEDACEYSSGNPLRDTIFETVPEVRVPSGTAGTVVIDGHTSRIWTWSAGSQSIAIYPAN